MFKNELDYRNDLINRYAHKYIADHTDNENKYHVNTLTDQLLEDTFKDCVIPAKKELYNDIKIRISELEKGLLLA